MTDFIACLQAAVASKALKQSKAEEALEAYDGWKAEYLRQGLDETAAAETAALRIADDIETGKRADKLRRLRQFEKSLEIDAELALTTGRSGSNPLHDHVLNMPSRIDWATNSNRGLFHGIVEEFINKMGAGVAGVRPGAMKQRAMVRELFGENTGNKSAKEVAAGLRHLDERIIELMRMHGLESPSDARQREDCERGRGVVGE